MFEEVKFKMDTKEIHRYICHRLVDLREKRGLTQTQVSENVNISQTELSKIENGSRTIEAVVLYKFANFYRVNISFFFPEK